MKVFYRILIALGIIVVGLIAALSVLVHIYLKPEKIRRFTIAKGEALLGRKVELQKIEVGLFKGILLKGLHIKERDGQTDFLRLKGLRIKFRLLPLLKKQLVITRAEMDGPYLRLVRDRKGAFNWESLKIFQKEEASRKIGEPSKGKALSKPVLALLVPHFEVRNGKLFFEDRSGRLPEMEIPFEIKASVSPEVLSARADFSLFKEPFRLAVEVKNYLSAPELKARLSGKTLDLNPLLKKSGPGKKSVAQRKPSPSSPSPSSISIPVAKGQLEVNLQKILYKKLALFNTRLTAKLDKGLLVSDFQTEVAGGKITDHLEAHLKDRPSWKVRETGEGVELAEVLSGLYPDLPGKIKGRISYQGDFAGSGLSLEEAQKNLTGQGSFQLKDLELTDIPVNKALSQVLNLPELKTLIFSSGQGNFEVKNERVFLKARLEGPKLSALLPSGSLDFKGYLDIPVSLIFSPELSKKLTGRLPLARHLLNRQGQVELTVLVKGPYRKPRVILSSQPLEEKLKQNIEQKLKGFLGL